MPWVVPLTLRLGGKVGPPSTETEVSAWAATEPSNSAAAEAINRFFMSVLLHGAPHAQGLTQIVAFRRVTSRTNVRIDRGQHAVTNLHTHFRRVHDLR